MRITRWTPLLAITVVMGCSDMPEPFTPKPARWWYSNAERHKRKPEPKRAVAEQPADTGDAFPKRELPESIKPSLPPGPPPFVGPPKPERKHAFVGPPEALKRVETDGPAPMTEAEFAAFQDYLRAGLRWPESDVVAGKAKVEPKPIEAPKPATAPPEPALTITREPNGQFSAYDRFGKRWQCPTREALIRAIREKNAQGKP